MTHHLVVYLLSYKRPEYIIEAIESILNQTYKKFDLIVSENSPDNIVLEALKNYKNDSRVRIIQRSPSLGSLDHFNLILKECLTYEYAMLFHDDDVLMPDALSEMMSILEEKKQISAISCNALIMKAEQKTSLLFNKNLLRDKFINTQSEVIQGYTNKNFGQTPFPSYIYRTRYLENMTLNIKHGGKHSDAAFIVDLTKRAPLYWVSSPLMYYRQHLANDSAVTYFKDIMSLCYYFLRNSPGSFLNVFIFFLKHLSKRILHV